MKLPLALTSLAFSAILTTVIAAPFPQPKGIEAIESAPMTQASEAIQLSKRSSFLSFLGARAFHGGIRAVDKINSISSKTSERFKSFKPGGKRSSRKM